MKRLIKIFAPDKNKILLVSFLLLLSVVAGLALPTLLSLIVDNGINKLDMTYIFKYSMFMLVIAIIGSIATILSVSLLAHLSAAFSTRLRLMVFEKANSLSLQKINEIGTGALLTRSTEDAWKIEQAAYSALSGLVTIPVSIIGGTVLALMKDWTMALIMLSSVPILVIIVFIIGKKTVPLWELSDKYIDLQNATIKERLTGIRVIRAFNREDRERAKAKKATEVMAENIIRANVMIGAIIPIAVTLLNVIVVAILFVGATKIQSSTSDISAGEVLSVVEYVAYAMIGIINMTFGIAIIPHAQVSYKRICEVLDAESIPDATDLDEESFKGNIHFDNVVFIYGDAQDPAISEISFDIKAGEKVAFIGGTGAGKSTLSHLLMGYYPKTSGEITFDDIPIEDISVQRLRKNISCVLQKTTIFAGTIKSNVQIGKLDATDEEIREVLDIAQLTSFAEEQKEKLEYTIQPAGSNLSGGQKQRISIARTLIKDAPIYLFDDSFSALDFLTESKIRAKLSKKLQGKTQLYITQRVASAMSCDKIYVMDKGKIVNSGNHKELLKTSKIYQEIYMSQTGKDLLSEEPN